MNDLARFQRVLDRGGMIALPDGTRTNDLDVVMKHLGLQPAAPTSGMPAAVQDEIANQRAEATGKHPGADDSDPFEGWSHPAGDVTKGLLPDGEGGYVQTTPEEVEAMKVADLSAALDALGLPIDGKKADLFGRLMTALWG